MQLCFDPWDSARSESDMYSQFAKWRVANGHSAGTCGLILGALHGITKKGIVSLRCRVLAGMSRAIVL